MMGVPELRQALAAHSARTLGLSLDWRTQVLVCSGGTEALAAAFLGCLNPGDEVIVFEPVYDSYVPMITRVGARAVVVQLHPPCWVWDGAELAAAFGPRTRMVVLNTPHNPTGKVFARQELQHLAGLVQRHGSCCALLDEVYQHLVHPTQAGAGQEAEVEGGDGSGQEGSGKGEGGGEGHVSLASLVGMEGRCLRVGSAGKTFSFTGWKVGWLTGPTALVKSSATAHQFLTFTTPAQLQRAVAHGLDHERAFFEGLGAMLAGKRRRLSARLPALGLEPLPAGGTYFLVADASRVMKPGEDDVQLCHRLTAEAGVTLIPVSAFYTDRAAAPRGLVRFVLCKADAMLDEACAKLERYLAQQQAAQP